ncbi:MAG: acyl-CoA dehydrogenase family protein, partial [Planctomycetia bacterium]
MNRAMFTPGRTAPDPETLAGLCAELAARADDTRTIGPWQSGAFASLARHGALAGFVPADCGGSAADEVAILGLFAAIAERCLTTALALSHWASACRIIAAADAGVRAARLPRLARGECPTTVGISQLSTSRRHLGVPAMRASRADGRWRLDGLCPWVTGADSCDTVVTGAVNDGGEPRFFVVSTKADGVDVAPPLDLLALSGSRTSTVTFRGVEPADVITPADGGVRTGGLATTALAVGATRASIMLVAEESHGRPELAAIAAGLRAEVEELTAALATAASQASDARARDRLRIRANGLVVRAAQAALAASKGAGFVAGHPAERLVR